MLVDYDARNYLMTAGIVGPEAWRRKILPGRGGSAVCCKKPAGKG